MTSKGSSSLPVGSQRLHISELLYGLGGQNPFNFLQNSHPTPQVLTNHTREHPLPHLVARPLSIQHL